MHGEIDCSQGHFLSLKKNQRVFYTRFASEKPKGPLHFFLGGSNPHGALYIYQSNIFYL